MSKPVRAPLLSMLLLLTGRPALADCPEAVRARSPADVATRIDSYGRSPQTYRALAGLGDPDVAANDAVGRLWDLNPGQRRLMARMLPGWRTDNWYMSGCRTGYALAAAQARIALLGERHPYVEQWMRVQRVAFSACRDRQREGPVALPAPMRVSDPALARLQRDDRGYQLASLIFYRDPPRAKAAFRAIAGSSSRHAPVARYMVAAVDADQMGDVYFGDQGPEARAARLARADSALGEAQAILDDPGLSAVHPLAQGLIGYLGYWTGGARARAAQVRAMLEALEMPLARIAADASARDRYARAIHDVEFLRRSHPDAAWWLTGAFPADASASRAMAAEARRDGFAAWLLFPASPFESGPWTQAGDLERGSWALLRRHAARQARRERGQAWAALRASLSTRYDPQGWDRIARLEREIVLCPSDDRLAAYRIFSYHQVRTALMHPAPGGFRRALGHLAAQPWRERYGYQQLFSDALVYLTAGGRLGEARLLRDRARPREFWYEESVPLLLLAEDEDAFVRELANVSGGGEALINLLPVARLALLAARGDVPPERGALFARVAWTRLYAAQRPIPRALDLLMRRLNPEITAGWTSRPGARPGSRGLLLDVLRSPGLNILITDHNRQRGNETLHGHSGLTGIDVYEHSDNNWWCAWQPLRHQRAASIALYNAYFAPEDYRARDPRAMAAAPAALAPLLRGSWLWNAQDRREQAALAQIPCAPRLLAERAIAWRGANPLSRLLGRDGQDEALALAVRATRYGCQRQGGHGAYSRTAFALLRRRFPDGAAARRTPYWFDCRHFYGGCDGRRRNDAERWAWR